MQSTYIIYVDSPYYQLLCCSIHTSSPNDGSVSYLVVFKQQWCIGDASTFTLMQGLFMNELHRLMLLIVYSYYIIFVIK